MKSKTFLILLGVCAVLALASLAVFQDGGEPSAPEGADYFASLPVNDVAAMTLAGPESEVALEKSGTVWQVANRYGYPADFDDIREFILKLRDLKVGRTFAADEESRKRLSLLPPDAADAGEEERGTRVTMKTAGGETVADLIIGAARESETGQGGHYLMPAGGETVYLVDESFQFMEMDPAQWLAQELLDISPGDVRRVTLLDPATGEEKYLLERPEEGEPPVFVAPGPAEQAGPVIDSKITNLFSALDGLTIRDVADPETPAAEMGLESPLCHEFWLFDGTTYTVCRGEAVADSDNERYVKVTAGYRTPPEADPETNPEADPETDPEADPGTGAQTAETAGEADADSPEEGAAGTSGNAEDADEDSPAEGAAEEGDAAPEAGTETAEPAGEDPAGEGPDPAQVAAEAEKKNEALSRWTFMVVEWKADRLETDVNEFFETPEPEAEAGAESEVIGGGS
jgi:hypothetical protein